MGELDIWQVILLALIQGVTEFLPISSAAHLQLPTLLLNWEDQGLVFDVATHGGSLIAVLVYFRKTLTELASASIASVFNRRVNSDTSYLLNLIIATVPIVIAGLLLQDIVASHLRNIAVIATATLVFGLLLGMADFRSQSRDKVSPPNQPMPMRFAWYIGFAQVFALIPGASRSGVVMTCALLLGLTRSESAKFAFLLGIPTIAGAFLFMMLDTMHQIEEFDLLVLAIAFFVSAVSTYICIDVFLRLIERIGMLPFVIYRIVLSIALGVSIWV